MNVLMFVLTWSIFEISHLQAKDEISDVADKDEPRAVDRKVPPWTKDEIKSADTDDELFGYCVSEGKRCGRTQTFSGVMDGRWVFCCPGLWCAPDPKTSQDLYSSHCFGGIGDTHHYDKVPCYFYEYVWGRTVCMRYDQYPPLPVDYKGGPGGDNPFGDEN